MRRKKFIGAGYGLSNIRSILGAFEIRFRIAGFNRQDRLFHLRKNSLNILRRKHRSEIVLLQKFTKPGDGTLFILAEVEVDVPFKIIAAEILVKLLALVSMMASRVSMPQRLASLSSLRSSRFSMPRLSAQTAYTNGRLRELETTLRQGQKFRMCAARAGIQSPGRQSGEQKSFSRRGGVIFPAA